MKSRESNPAVQRRRAPSLDSASRSLRLREKVAPKRGMTCPPRGGDPVQVHLDMTPPNKPKERAKGTSNLPRTCPKTAKPLSEIFEPTIKIG